MQKEASGAHRVASKCDATTCWDLVPSRMMTWDEISSLNLSRSGELEFERVSQLQLSLSQLLLEYYLRSGW